MTKKFLGVLLLVIWLFLVGYYLLPLKKPINYHPYIQNESILATQQFCSNQCADIVLKKGVIAIPDSIFRDYPGLRTDVANLKGETPFRQKSGTLMYPYDFILFGKFDGIDSTVLEGYVPVYRVREWYPTQYIARFWQLTGIYEVLYLGLLYLGLPLLLYFILRIKERIGNNL